MDYREINAATRQGAYLLPRIDATLDFSSWFCVLHNTGPVLWELAGNWRKLLRKKMLFSTPNWHFELGVNPLNLSY